MTRGVGLLSTSLYFEYAYAKVGVNQKVLDDVGLNKLNFLNFLVLHNLFVNNRFLVIHIHHSYIAFLIRDIKFLMLAIPEDRGIDTLVWVSNGEKFSIISCIKAFQILVMTYCKNEVCLDHDKYLNDSNAVRRFV
jgi:hypothetical protein